MTKKILFIQPPLTLEERYGKLAGGGSSAPPIGLAQVAAAVRNSLSYDVIILDAEALELTISDTIKRIRSENPDYIGITAVTPSIYKASLLAKAIKDDNSEQLIILGGPHVTAIPEYTLKNYPCFDLAVLGEGEDTTVELLQSLKNGKCLTNVAGIAYRDNGNILKTPKRLFITDMDRLPFPAWDLLPNIAEYYRPPIFSVKRLPSTSLVTTRGCPGKCTFCDTSVFGQKVRGFSPEYVLKMINRLMHEYGIKDILFDDDCAPLLKARFERLLDMLIESDLGLSWSCNSRIDIVRPDVLKKMKRAGCWQIAYGIESGSQKILDFYKKGITLKKIEEALAWTRDAGIMTKGFFMVGNPLETSETVEETINFAKRIKLDDFQITSFTPLPGSAVYPVADKYGWFDNDFRRMNMWNIVFVPNGLSKKDILHYSKKAFRSFYFRPSIILSYLKRMRSRKHLIELLRGFNSLVSYLFVKEK
ncbi:MAG: hypothetical protein COV46_01600 [Deltaproteobacteria bacterium CG11_big_fil_rev_8_21_14_0_20_49_13]|nr:MAG: hypothetical protein COV46_01600 [Deltaproteobacteria bacterium CG11_big_fil_rev_8_21_14_0_20_49_13]